MRVIKNEKNLGFAGGNNAGLRAATGQVQIVLNNDTFVTNGWVRDLIRPLLIHDDIGMAGPLTNMIGNEQKIAINYSTMEEMASRSAAFVSRRRHNLYETNNLAFFCVALKREVVRKVGYLDEEYGMGYFEDDDYCARVRQAGYRLVVCDGVFVHHHLSASFNQLGEGKRAGLLEQNRKIFEKKWGPWAPHNYRRELGFGE